MASPPDFTGTSTTTPVKSLSSFSHPIVLILLYALYHHTYVSSPSPSLSVCLSVLNATSLLFWKKIISHYPRNKFRIPNQEREIKLKQIFFHEVGWASSSWTSFTGCAVVVTDWFPSSVQLQKAFKRRKIQLCDLHHDDESMVSLQVHPPTCPFSSCSSSSSSKL